jgi:hypothetical protein
VRSFNNKRWLLVRGTHDRWWEEPRLGFTWFRRVGRETAYCPAPAVDRHIRAWVRESIAALTPPSR